MNIRSELEPEPPMNAENRATVEQATARLVNQALEQRARTLALDEEARAALEHRVWRWALRALVGFVLLCALFAGLSVLHWI